MPPRNWKVQSLGVLESLTKENAVKAIDFVKEYRVDIIKILAGAWGVLLLITFTLILTVRAALNFPF